MFIKDVSPIKTKKYVQRRQYVRFRVDGATIGVSRDRYTKMGQVVDISMGGLSFRYFDGGLESAEFPQSAQMVILLAPKDFHLENIPFQTVLDFPVQPTFLEMRQRCVQFVRLTSTQLVQLEYFIANLAGGPVMDSRRQPERRLVRLREDRNNQPDVSKSDIIDRRSGKDRRSYYH